MIFNSLFKKIDKLVNSDAEELKNSTNEKYIKLEKNIKNLENEIKSLKTENYNQNRRIDELNILSETIGGEITEKRYFCPVCKNKINYFIPFGNPPRKHAQCPICYSLERHRAVFLFFNKKELIKENIKLLHFAPEKVFFDYFNKCNLDYWPVDLFMKDNIRERVDMQNIPYEDNSFDLIFNSHVLEHVPDDFKALNELYRVLKPEQEGGCMVVMIPQSRKEATFENKEYNTPELRLKHYGQSNHLRIYGKDFKKRLESVNFKVEEYEPKDITEEDLVKKYSIQNEKIFFCTKK